MTRMKTKTWRRKMMKTKIEPAMKTVAFVFAALLLASCGRGTRDESLGERSDKA